MHNTSEMVDCGTHIRTAPFARAIYNTAATEVVINAWNDVHANQASAAEIGVYVDGVYQESVRATANGASTHTVTLPEGDKRVEIVTNGYRGATPVNIPSLIGPSIWLRSLQFNAPAVAVPPSTERGVVIIGESIANGSKLPSAIQQAYARILQQEVDFPVTVIGRGGLALHDITVGLGTETNFRPKKLVREVVKYNPALVIFALGYNDAARNVWGTAAAYRDAIDAVAADIAAHLPGVEMGAMSMLHTTNPQGTYASIKDAALICTKAVGFAAPVLTAADLDVDGVHPNAEGHIKIADRLRPFVTARAMPPAVQPFNYEVDPLAIGYSFNRNGLTYNSYDGYSDEGPRWYTRADTPVPGDFHRYRAFLEAGSATAYTGTGQPAFGVWSSNITHGKGFTSYGNFRVRVEIARANTTDVLATYYIWRGAGMAPT